MVHQQSVKRRNMQAPNAPPHTVHDPFDSFRIDGLQTQRLRLGDDTETGPRLIGRAQRIFAGSVCRRRIQQINPGGASPGQNPLDLARPYLSLLVGRAVRQAELNGPQGQFHGRQSRKA